MKIVKLGEVVNLFNGSTPSKTNKNYWENGDVPWFTVDDLRKQGKYITYTEKFITKLGLKESSISLIPENAVLLCCTASVGAIAINKIRLTTNQQFNALVVKNTDHLLVEYLYYWFLANMDTLKSLGRATTIDYVSMSKLRDMTLQLPSLEKQQLIVEKLDIAYAEIGILRSQIKTQLLYVDAIGESLLNNAFTQNEGV
jgi:restriction endonuclease S subunit